jgi:hypothetical protein
MNIVEKRAFYMMMDLRTVIFKDTLQTDCASSIGLRGSAKNFQAKYFPQFTEIPGVSRIYCALYGQVSFMLCI